MAIARVLVQDPDVILADEPVSSVDPTLGRTIIELLVQLAEIHRKTLVANLHAVSFALNFFPRVIGVSSWTNGVRSPPAAVTEQVLADLYAGLETSPVLSGFSMSTQLQCPDLEYLARLGIATRKPGDPPGYSGSRGSAGCELAYRPDRARLLFGAQEATYLGLSHGSVSAGLSATFLRLLIVPTIETIQISIMGTALAIMVGFPLALLATDRLCFAGVVYEMDGDSSRWRRLSRRSLYLAARCC